ncbi:hypothetical protein EDC30_103221 [Paucimonas lemoignei]|uniref:Lipoprotein n=1 Tax=Paucimonas lemoignei TaxID=29443 RepID=A0A4R3I225_PAULE|nr:hypothetical protein [Paucimonas lemoignei]TCS37929.1 hypothetical protein EDC30_103221 [Paucimonas lemoignei]
MFKRIYVVLLLLVFGGCNNAGKQFVGNWVAIDDARVSLEITHNGGNFLIKTTYPTTNWSAGFQKDGSIPKMLVTDGPVPAQFRDGMLEIPGMLGPSRIDIVKSNGNLVFNGRQFKRTQ